MYLEDFKSNEDVACQFASDKEDVIHILKTLNSSIVHLAWYGAGTYDGQSMVIFESSGILYEVIGSHCSCYGLEGQWKPEETDWRALRMRELDDYYDSEKQAGEYLKELCDQKIGEVNGNV